ncbi:hypothetical protein Vadar_018393 [Vaccinium darrowii]|uniref:Uncharacterized protein n=1 Tax=Vaccinium darrowii TaxID=229202 RepID=A0ACB7ZK11_9ERIC|nr:hypothetical protein Vadar_018393 [Vaccinium darrowii]
MSIDQIYIPLNSGGHWICIKVDMGKQMTYLFDSMPCSPSNCRRLNLASVVHHTDMYDCGLFVIKFMQGVDYPPGVHLMDDNERPRNLGNGISYRTLGKCLVPPTQITVVVTGTWQRLYMTMHQTVIVVSRLS